MAECEQLPCLETKALVFNVWDRGPVPLTGNPIRTTSTCYLWPSGSRHKARTIHCLLAPEKRCETTKNKACLGLLACLPFSRALEINGRQTI